MSAFIVGNDHVNALLTYAIDKQVSYFNPGASEWTTIVERNADAVGRILMDENVRSVACRYEGRIDDDEKNAGADYAFARYPTPLTPVEAIKACHCLDYQSCETDDWEASIAWRILKAIEGHAVHHIAGYDAAPWEITERSAKDLKHAGQISLMSLVPKRR